MEDTKLQQHVMFANPLWTAKCPSHKETQSQYIETLESYREKTINLNQRHHRTFITADDLQHNINFSNFVEDIGKAIVELKKDWSLEDGTKIGIQKMWGSITKPGGILMPHQVPFTFLYGMYFLKTPPQSGNLVVDNPTYDSSFFATLSVNEINSFNTPKFTFPMPEGHVVFLPGHLDTYTTINDDELDRYILHFSLVIVR